LENTPIVKTNIWTDDAGFTLSVKEWKNIPCHCQGRPCECNRVIAGKYSF
jgi:hypothetical protein